MPGGSSHHSCLCSNTLRPQTNGASSTLSPTARREVLDRLLALNYQRHAEELAAGLHDKKKPAGKRAAGKIAAKSPLSAPGPGFAAGSPVPKIATKAFLARQSVFLHPQDARFRTYIIGKTGSGKTTLLKNLIAQHIQQGGGVALIDPHSDLSQELLEFIPPHRTDDVVYFDPADVDFPIGFNPLAHGLGLVPADTYTTLEKDGCACDKGAPPMHSVKQARPPEQK